MSSTNTEKSPEERREVVVEVLAQAVLDLILDGKTGVGREPQPEAPRGTGAGGPARVVVEVAHAAV